MVATSNVRGSFLDSPLFSVPATDHTFVLIRLKCIGRVTSSMFHIRLGVSLPEADFATGDAVWGQASSSVVRSVPLYTDEEFHTYAVRVADGPLAATPESLGLNITQLRWTPINENGPFPGTKQFTVQHISIVDAPSIQRVVGCKPVVFDQPVSYPRAAFQVWQRWNGSTADQYFSDPAVATSLRLHGSLDASLPYSATYDCDRAGGDTITIDGTNFGLSQPRVLIGGRACTNVKLVSPDGTRLTCRVPPGIGEAVNVTIINSRFPVLSGSKPYLSYAVAAAAPQVVVASNIGARHLDLNWKAHENMWEAMTVTGYKIEWRRAKTLLEVTQGMSFPRDYVFDNGPNGRPTLLDALRPWEVSAAYLQCCSNAWEEWSNTNSMVVGNVTVTTVVGLLPDTRYQFRIAALVESTLQGDVADLDLYGRRAPLPGYIEGPFSKLTVVERTLDADFAFPFFDANSTLNHGPADSRASIGQLNSMAGEGHYGLLLVGSGNIAGCNATHSCCDRFGGGEEAIQRLQPRAFHWLEDMEEAYMGSVAPVDQSNAEPATRKQRQIDQERVVLDVLATAPANTLGKPFGNYSTAYLNLAARHNSLVSLALRNGWSTKNESDFQSQLWATSKSSHQGSFNFAGLMRAHLQGAAHPSSSCSLQCAAIARLRPPYLNGKALRDSDVYAIPRDASGFGSNSKGLNTSSYAYVLEPFASEHNSLRGVAVAVLDARVELPSPTSRSAYTIPPAGTKYPSGVQIGNPKLFSGNATAPCGPALRLTAPLPRQVGAAWYPRAQQLREGFDTRFRFRFSSPSTYCRIMDDSYTNCRSRGGDGLAFVLQNQHPSALGHGGHGLGYAGIKNSLAVEFDTFMNFDQLDPYENHISVQTRGFKDENSANHSYSLGQTVRALPDLTDGIIDVRITYSPKFDTDSASLVADNLMHMSDFLTNAEDYMQGGLSQWSSGLGVLKVYLFNRDKPLLTVPCSLDETLQLDNGRGWVGFTASTGDNAYQSAEILSWEFTQTRQDLAALRREFPFVQ